MCWHVPTRHRQRDEQTNPGLIEKFALAPDNLDRITQPKVYENGRCG
jgi:hypothetical protein